MIDLQSIKADRVVAFMDWNNRLHIQYAVSRKYIHAIRISKRGPTLVNIKRRKAEVSRGIKWVPRDHSVEIISRLCVALEHKKTTPLIHQLFYRLYALLGPSCPGEGEATRMPGSVDVTASPSDSPLESDQITQAGAAR